MHYCKTYYQMETRKGSQVHHRYYIICNYYPTLNILFPIKPLQLKGFPKDRNQQLCFHCHQSTFEKESNHFTKELATYCNSPPNTKLVRMFGRSSSNQNTFILVCKAQHDHYFVVK